MNQLVNKMFATVGFLSRFGHGGKSFGRTASIVAGILLVATSLAQAATFSIGDRVNATATLNVRSTPAGTAVGQHFTGDLGTVSGGPTNAAFGGVTYSWWRVTWDTAPTSGWSIQDAIAKVTATPIVTSVTPNPAIGANTALTLAINGSGFVSGATVTLRLGSETFNISAANTTFISASRIDIRVTLGNDPVIWTAQVTNPGGQSSSQMNFQVNAPVPIITSLSPISANAGGSPFILTVNAPTFHGASVVRWKGNNLATVPVVTPGGLTTALQATVPASLIAVAGSALVTVFSPGPGGGISSAVTFPINSVGPLLTSVTPNPATGANNPQTLSLNGSGFVSGATVTLRLGSQTFNISAANTTFVSASRIDINVILGNDPLVWTAQVTNPGGQSSSQIGFQVNAPVPIITSLSQNSANAGGPQFTLTVNGPTFHETSMVRWNGNNLVTVPVVTPGGLITALQATVPASFIAVAGSALVTVFSPGPGGGTSPAVSFPINNVGPQLTSVTPNPATGANGPQSLRLDGGGFVSGATVTLRLGSQTFNISAANTTFVSANRVDVFVTLGNDPLIWTAQVTNPGAQSSIQVSFQVNAPVPIITSLSQNSANAGGSQFILTVNGPRFHGASVVRWNGIDLATTPVMTPGGLTTDLQATVPASLIAVAGSAAITVYSPGPGGGTSSAATFSIRASGSCATEPAEIARVPSVNFNDRPVGQLIDSIVFHTTEGNYASAINRLTDTSVPLEQRVSAHYVIKSTGEIVQLVDLSKRGWHANYYNDRSIGIEMVGYAGQSSTWNPENLAALENLVAWLATQYPIPIQHPAGDASSYPNCRYNEPGFVAHSQVQSDSCTGFGVKADPGPYFPWTTFVENVQAKASCRPNLAFRIETGNRISISWPLIHTGFTLEAALSHGPGASWNPVSPPPTVIAGRYWVTNNLTGGTKFYRLRKP